MGKSIFSIFKLIIFCLYINVFLSSALGFDPYKSRLTVDYGPRNIGIAVALGQNIQPLCTISNCGNLTLVSGEVINLARAHGVIEIIVGIPVDRDGRIKYTINNFNGILCLNFSSILSSISNKHYPKANVLIMDERYTTREAREKSKIDYPRASLDAVSAACLLERYLEDEGTFNILPALPCAYPPPYDLENFDYGIVQKHIRITKYQYQQAEYGYENTRMRKFGLKPFVRRMNVDGSNGNGNGRGEEEVVEELDDYRKYSFTSNEYARIKALKVEELGSKQQSLDVIDRKEKHDEDDTLLQEEKEEVGVEEVEESEEDRQYRIRAMRRKKGTLRRL